jgi:hypothetical protein
MTGGDNRAGPSEATPALTSRQQANPRLELPRSGCSSGKTGRREEGRAARGEGRGPIQGREQFGNWYVVPEPGAWQP